MELLDILDENGNYTGNIEERKVVHEKGYWHLHVGVWIMNKKGELLFQKRSHLKEINPNKWTRTGGHVEASEQPVFAIQRETMEEIGVKIPIEKFELMNIDKNETFFADKQIYNRQFTYNYFVLVDYEIEDYIIQKEEVSDLKYITLKEMKEAKCNNDTSFTFVNWNNIDEVITMLEKQIEKYVNKI